MAVMRGIRPYGLRLPKLFPGASVRQLLQGLLRERTCAAGCCSPGQKTGRRAVGRSPGRRDSVHEGGERDSVQKPPPTDRPATFELHGSGAELSAEPAGALCSAVHHGPRPQGTPPRLTPAAESGSVPPTAVQRLRHDVRPPRNPLRPLPIHMQTRLSERIASGFPFRRHSPRRNMPNGDRCDDPRTKRFRCMPHPRTAYDPGNFVRIILYIM